MAAYSFNSEPRVVSTRSEKFKPEDRMSMNLMYDKRVFRGHVHDIHNIRPVLSPQEQEELHLQKEKEKKQEEMMKRQLEAFKKNKTKQSPYDIRPAATGRIEVDLQYFLTDQKDVKPNDSEIGAQTDEFLPKPPDQIYVPKKTGKDVHTQIEDGDLFSFNSEVQPILNVLTSKTLEQALLEVEEESEMSAMEGFKSENQARKIEEEKSWAHMVREEAEKIQKKNQDFQIARTKHVKTLNLVSKFQNLSLAKLYISDLFPKVLDEYTQQSLQADNITHLLHNHYLPFILEGTMSYLENKAALCDIPTTVANESRNHMIESRGKIVKQHKQKARKEQIRNINFSDTKRFVRFLYINPLFYVQSEFTMRIGYMLKGEEYPENLNDSVLLKDTEKKEGEEGNPVAVEKETVGKPEWAKYLTFLVDDIKRFGFAVANHPILDTPKDLRKYGVLAECYSESGALLFSLDNSSTETYPGLKINSTCRDLTKKTSEDEVLIITLSSISEDVHHIFLYTYSIRPTPTDYKYARYQLADFSTSQKLDMKSIKADEFQADENGNVLPLYLAYRIYRKERNPRNLRIVMDGENPIVELPAEEKHWVLEVYNLPIGKSIEEAKSIIQKLLEDGWNYSKQLTEGLINYRTMKLLQDIEYKKLLDETEQPGSKKKKKRPVKGKAIEEPQKMTEYVPPPPVYQSRSFGPIMIDTCTDSIDKLYENAKQAIDPELLKTFDTSMEIYIKNKPIKKISWILKANNLKDLTINQQKPDLPPVLDNLEQNLDI